MLEILMQNEQALYFTYVKVKGLLLSAQRFIGAGLRMFEFNMRVDRYEVLYFYFSSLKSRP
jgi:hypothetical protein